jgi:hypothetical protein
VESKKKWLIEIVGKQNCLDDSQTLEAYSYDQSFVQPLKPQFVVKPENAQEIQKIVAWANDTGTPLIPVSSGLPRFRGDTVPTAPEAVIIDLSRMNTIIRIDRRNRMAMIEPGVTYAQLQPELEKKGLSISNPLLPRRSKSVIASLLEREPMLIPKFNFTLMEPLRCTEVIWGNGEILRTGESYGYPTLEQQWDMGLAQVTPTGPGQTDYYRLVSGAQGSMGIVTWASVRCNILPQVHKFFFIPANSLKNLIDCAYKLLRVRLGDEFLIMNRSSLAFMLGKNSDEIKAIKDKLPSWTIIIGIAGRYILPEEKVDFQEKDIRGITQQFGLQLVSTIPGAGDRQVMEALLNPSKEPYWKLRYKGACQDIFFQTTLDRTTEFVDIVNSEAESKRFPISDIGVYIQPQLQGVLCHCEFNLPYNPQNKTEVSRVKELFTKGSEALIKRDAYFSRPYGIWADMVYSRDVSNTTMLKTVKDIFDPNHILNPGKLCF